MCFHSQSPVLLPDQYGAFCQKMAWRHAVHPCEEQGACKTKTFVCSCMLCTTVNKYEWTILRLLWLRREQLVPGPHCPLSLHSSQSNETWIDWKHKGSLMTGSGSFWLNHFADNVNNNKPNVIHAAPGIAVTQTNFQFDSQNETTIILL